MNQILQNVILEHGIQLLNHPSELRSRLLDAGSPEVYAIKLELVLNACPSVVSTLMQESIYQAEVNLLLNHIIQDTSLSAIIAREILGDLIAASGIQTCWPPLRFGGLIRKRAYDVRIDETLEDTVFQTARAGIKGNADPAISLSIMDKMARDGNAYASYYLGDYYHEIDMRKKTNLGQEYYQLAADLGYGPAYGGLADYAIQSGKIEQAVSYFEYPTALAGKDGKHWIKNSKKILEYRTNNQSCSKNLLLLSMIFLLVSVFIAMQIHVLLGVSAVILSMFCLVRTIYSLVYAPYHSHRMTYYAMFACWLFTVISLI